MTSATRRRVCVAAVGVGLVGAWASARPRAADAWIEPYRAVTAKIIAEATANANAWNRLAELSDSFPARLSGSDNLQHAIQ